MKRDRTSHSSRRLEREWNLLLDQHQRECAHCGKEYRLNFRDGKPDPNLQFAHTSPTSLNGMGRGKWNRLLDIKKHPECYILLCKRCHYKFDNKSSDIGF